MSVNENTGRTVVVGLSGGVDSAVAAMLLKEQGWHVIGLFMKNWEDDDDDEYCSSRQDLIDVMSIADRIGIDVDVVNFAREYKERVFAEFLKEYQAGRTPNPDVLCNSEIKFRALLAPTEPGAAFENPVSAGGYLQARCAKDGRSGGAARGGEKGFDGNLFHWRATVQGISDALSAAEKGRDSLSRR